MLAEEEPESSGDADNEAADAAPEPEGPQYVDPPVRQYSLGDLLQVRRESRGVVAPIRNRAELGAGHACLCLSARAAVQPRRPAPGQWCWTGRPFPNPIKPFTQLGGG